MAAEEKERSAMKATKRGIAIAVTLGVWTAALSAAAALSYDLNRPLHVRSAAAPTERVTPPPLEQPVQVEIAASPPSVITMPTLDRITAEPRHRVAAPPPKVTKAKDLSDMHCADWRGLNMGRGHVQVCD
jgi:hypothetical protein